MLQVKVMQPKRLTRPNVGRKPVVPQTRQGETMLPRVSLPSANPTSPAATVAAEPADEPLDPCAGFQGLRVFPPNHWSPMAKAPRESFAARTAPASSNRRATVAVHPRVWPLNGAAPQVVLYPGTAIRSFAP